jgi:transposase InsO family protein
MMLEANVAAVAPSTVYRVLKRAGLIGRSQTKPSQKGSGFLQPLVPHQHWHIDVSYVNITGTFYYLISILDGYSRFIVHWEIRERSTERDVEIVLQPERLSGSEASAVGGLTSARPLASTRFRDNAKNHGGFGGLAPHHRKKQPKVLSFFTH